MTTSFAQPAPSGGRTESVRPPTACAPHASAKQRTQDRPPCARGLDRDHALRPYARHQPPRNLTYSTTSSTTHLHLHPTIPHHATTRQFLATRHPAASRHGHQRLHSPHKLGPLDLTRSTNGTPSTSVRNHHSTHGSSSRPTQHRRPSFRPGPTLTQARTLPSRNTGPPLDMDSAANG